MKSESEIRSLISYMRMFDIASADGADGLHGREIRALEWVLDEYPPKPIERPTVPPPDPNIATPMGPAGFPVRNFPSMRTGAGTGTKKEGS